jgi:predicted transcriptional regulator YdeE
LVKVVEKTFMVVCEKNRGHFKEYAEAVPKAAQLFLKRESEIPFSSGTEVTVYEQPQQQNQVEGTFYVGVLVDEKVNELPTGMDYLEVQHRYAMTSGKVSEMGTVYSNLDKWIITNNYQYASANNYIIEVYYPVENDVENVEVYIPIAK